MKALGIIVLIPLFIICGALISGFFLYMGWNWGMVHAVPDIAKNISFAQSFWTALAFWTIGSAFKASQKES